MKSQKMSFLLAGMQSSSIANGGNEFDSRLEDVMSTERSALISPENWKQLEDVSASTTQRDPHGNFSDTRANRRRAIGRREDGDRSRRDQEIALDLIARTGHAYRQDSHSSRGKSNVIADTTKQLKDAVQRFMQLSQSTKCALSGNCELWRFERDCVSAMSDEVKRETQRPLTSSDANFRIKRDQAIALSPL